MRNEDDASAPETTAKTAAAISSVGRTPQASAARPARGATTTITPRLSDRSVVLVRAWSSSGVSS